MIVRFFIFLVSYTFFCFAEELDVETLPTRRTKQYSIFPYEKICIFSAPRTGSSLVYNVCRYLFENMENFHHHHNTFHPDCLVLKDHRDINFNQNNGKKVLYIVPIRNPIDACISNYRIESAKNQSNKNYPYMMLKYQASRLIISENLLATGNDVIHIKYEDFSNDFDFLFHFLEINMNILISESDKEIIRIGYSKENIYSSIAMFSNFKECLPISGFHGKHVLLEAYTPPKRVLSQLNLHLPEFKPLFQKYGYFLD